MRLTRRKVLTLMGLAALGVWVPACREMFKQFFFAPSAAPVPPSPAPVNPFRTGGKSLVAIVHGDDVARMVERAVDLIGGVGRLPIRGRRVLIKPNVVWGQPPPATTDPRVVHAVAALVQPAHPARLAVGDMSAVTALPTRPHLERTGIARAAREAGAEVLAFEEGEWVLVKPAGVEFTAEVYVAKAAYETEVLVSVPVIKTHRSATYSCALKNAVGCVHGRNKPWNYGSDGWEPAVAELNVAVRSHLYVVDGLQTMVAGGPWSGPAERTRVILASGDPVATDIVALGILQAFGRSERVLTRGPWGHTQIRRAIRLGLGAGAPDEVGLVVEDQTGGNRQFTELVTDIERLTGVAASRGAGV